MIPFRCPCGWSGQAPSLTDASVERVVNGVVTVDRVHQALCPRCFEVVKRTDWESAMLTDSASDALP